MTRHPRPEPFPPRRMVVDFFSRRDPPALAAAAALLGWPQGEVRRRAAEESAVLPGERVPWEDVAFWLTEAWERERIVRALGTRADLLPALWLPQPVPWRIPAYVTLAMQHQAARDHPRWSVSDYVAHQLHLVIDERTVSALGEGEWREGFVAAYRFPESG